MNVSQKRKCPEDRTDCFAYSVGICKACEETDPGWKPCPFYKTQLTRLREHLAGVQRLKDLGRQDLIDKFHNAKEQKTAMASIIRL